MKRRRKTLLILYISMLLMVCFSCTGCKESEEEKATREAKIQQQQEAERLKAEYGFTVIIDNYEDNYKIAYHNKTKVMYTISYGKYNRGTSTRLDNPDGTPLVYDGD